MITQETICEAIRVSWKIAGDAPTVASTMRRWGNVESELTGMWDLINFSVNGQKREELLDDISLLKAIAYYHAFGIIKRRAA
jgi:hypothetical protein